MLRLNEKKVCLFIQGDDVGIDVLGVHDTNTREFLRYTVSLLGYGFHGDLLNPSEALRWLGPGRYDIAGKIHPSFSLG